MRPSAMGNHMEHHFTRWFLQAPAPGACPNGDSTATLSDENSEGPYYVDVSRPEFELSVGLKPFPDQQHFEQACGFSIFAEFTCCL